MVLFSLIEMLNKKYQQKALNQMFDFVELIYLTTLLFDSQHKKHHSMKMLKLYKTIFCKFLIDDEGIIKVDKTLLRLIDDYNKIQKKYNKNHSKENLCKEHIDECNSEVSSEDSNSCVTQEEEDDISSCTEN